MININDVLQIKYYIFSFTSLKNHIKISKYLSINKKKKKIFI